MVLKFFFRSFFSELLKNFQVFLDAFRKFSEFFQILKFGYCRKNFFFEIRNFRKTLEKRILHFKFLGVSGKLIKRWKPFKKILRSLRDFRFFKEFQNFSIIRIFQTNHNFFWWLFLKSKKIFSKLPFLKNFLNYVRNFFPEFKTNPFTNSIMIHGNTSIVDLIIRRKTRNGRFCDDQIFHYHVTTHFQVSEKNGGFFKIKWRKDQKNLYREFHLK